METYADSKLALITEYNELLCYAVCDDEHYSCTSDCIEWKFISILGEVININMCWSTISSLKT